MGTLLKELVERLGGQLTGDENTEVFAIASLDDATASCITFLSNPRFRTKAAQTRAAALILSAADDLIVGPAYNGARIITDNPYAYFARVAQWFAAQRAIVVEPGIHPSAIVDSSARVAASAWVGPHVVIEAEAVVAEQSVIDAGCYIGRAARIGAATHLFAHVSVHAAC